MAGSHFAGGQGNTKARSCRRVGLYSGLLATHTRTHTHRDTHTHTHIHTHTHKHTHTRARARAHLNAQFASACEFYVCNAEWFAPEPGLGPDLSHDSDRLGALLGRGVAPMQAPPSPPCPPVFTGFFASSLVARLGFLSSSSSGALCDCSVRSGQVSFNTRPRSRTMRAKQKEYPAGSSKTERRSRCPNKQRAGECRSYGVEFSRRAAAGTRGDARTTNRNGRLLVTSTALEVSGCTGCSYNLRDFK
jgi:hypothetical protein